VLGEVGEGNRKDLRDAVEAAHAAGDWGRGAGHMRAQILYYIAENLSARGTEFAARIADMNGVATDAGRQEVEATITRLFSYAAWADKYDGAVHHVPIRGVTLAMNEPIGVVGLVAPEAHPLLGFVSLVAPAIAVGNTVIVVPSTAHPLAATDFYGVLETSDLPGGVVNIVTGDGEALAKILGDHLDVDAVWFCGSAAGGKAVEEASAGNMKRTWLPGARDWRDARQGEGREFLRHATQVKNIWIPYGE
jgi:aldehyde dehydrogenase (NAD+)